MRIQFSADDVRLAIGRDSGGKISPTVTAAQHGAASIELTRAELESFLVALVQTAVEEHGAKIQSAELTLAPVGDRAIACSLRLRATKLLVGVDLKIGALAEVDEHLSLRISGLKATGDGLIDSIVAGVLDARLEDHEGRTFELAPRALENVKLTDLKLEAGDPVRISAAFEV